MQARKYILVVAEKDSPLALVAVGLTSFEFRVTLARDEATARGFIENASDISLIAVDGSLVEDASAFLAATRDRHRDLPIMWLDAGDGTEFRGEPPDEMLALPLDAAVFSARAKELLFDDFYPKSMVHGLLSAGNAVLSLTFETGVECGEPWLKQTERLPGMVHAYIPFMSDKASGHLITSGDIHVLAALGERIGFDLEDGERQVAIDMAGEIANQVIGRMKSLSDVLGDVRMGVPVVWVGMDIAAHFSSDKPNLSVQFETEVGQVHLDFGLHAFSGEAGEEDELMEAGDVELF